MLDEVHGSRCRPSIAGSVGLARVSPPGFAQPTDYMQRIQQSYRALSATCDVDNDGMLTREEASPCVRRAPLFDSMDVNRDCRATPTGSSVVANIPIYAR